MIRMYCCCFVVVLIALVGGLVALIILGVGVVIGCCWKRLSRRRGTTERRAAAAASHHASRTNFDETQVDRARASCVAFCRQVEAVIMRLIPCSFNRCEREERGNTPDIEMSEYDYESTFDTSSQPHSHDGGDPNDIVTSTPVNNARSNVSEINEPIYETYEPYIPSVPPPPVPTEPSTSDLVVKHNPSLLSSTPKRSLPPLGLSPISSISPSCVAIVHNPIYTNVMKKSQPSAK